MCLCVIVCMRHSCSRLTSSFVSAKRKAFELKRKQHYNEGKSLKLAKKLVDEVDKEIEVEERKSSNAGQTDDMPQDMVT